MYKCKKVQSLTEHGTKNEQHQCGQGFQLVPYSFRRSVIMERITKGGNKMFEMEEEKIIQIMPAPPGGYVKHEDENGRFYTKIVGMALTNYGVAFLDTDDYGMIELLNGGKEVVFLKEPPKDEYNEN